MHLPILPPIILLLALAGHAEAEERMCEHLGAAPDCRVKTFDARPGDAVLTVLIGDRMGRQVMPDMEACEESAARINATPALAMCGVWR